MVAQPYARPMLIDTQRIITFHGDTLQDAATMLRDEISTLPLTARVTSLTSECHDGRCSGMAVVDLIPEVDSAAPATETTADEAPTGDAPDNVTMLRTVDPLPDSL